MAIRKRNIVLGAVLVLIIAFGAFVIIASRVPKPAIASAAGKPAPEFTLKDQDGKDFSLASLRGHRVLLMFYRGYW